MLSLRNAFIGLMVTTLVACAAPVQNTGGGQSEIIVRDAWARPTMGMHGDSGGHGGHGGGQVSAAYMVIENKGSAPDRLLSATGDVAGMIEVHQTTQKDGMMMMEEMKDGLEVPANGSVELKPAGYHIMLMDLKRDLKPGDAFKLTLKFQSGKAIDVNVTVREP
jgi:copper(I)-binding protein